MTGTVDFLDGGVTISGCDAQPVTGGVAACSTNALSGSVHSITAVYSGDTNYAASTSHILMQDMRQPSSVLLITSGTPSVYGQPVTFTATISPSAAITGTVAFMDGLNPISGCGAKPVTLTLV